VTGHDDLFAYRDVENSRTAIALYDRGTGSVSTILTQPTAREGELALYPKWQNDGNRALVTIYRGIPGGSSDGACELVLIPVGIHFGHFPLWSAHFLFSATARLAIPPASTLTAVTIVSVYD
jgi:hypothetical protein